MPSYDAMLAGAGSAGVTFTGAEAMEGLKGAEAASAPSGELKVGRERKRKLQEWDRMLKDFRYGDALDSVMRKVGPRKMLCREAMNQLTNARPLPSRP